MGLIARLSVAVLTLLLSAGAAWADVSKKVIATFKGQVIVTAGEVDTSGDDKATIAAFKKAKVASVTGAPNGDDVHAWTFSYTAFLSKAGGSALALEFYSGKSLVADQALNGVDPKSLVLGGDITLTEDDGPTKGKTYTLKIVQQTGKRAVLASTTITMK